MARSSLVRPIDHRGLGARSEVSMYAAFQVLGLLRKVEPLAKGVRIEVEVRRGTSASLLPMMCWDQEQIERLGSCRNGDLLLILGQLGSPRVGEGKRSSCFLRVHLIDQLITGFDHHASGRCRRGVRLAGDVEVPII